VGEHDQTVLHDEDAHGDIHDDGRTLDHPEFAPGAGAGAEDDVYNDTPVYRDSHGKLIPDTVHVRLRAFSVTQWESQYSTVFAPVDFRLFEPSFAPVVDDSWRVVGHLGWIDGYDICVPYDTVRTGSKFWYILQARRLGEWRQQLLDEADRFDRGPLPFPVHPVHAPVPPGRFSTLWDDARRGPLKEKSIEEIYQNNLNYFLRGGGKAFVGGGALDSDYAPYLDLPPAGLPDEGVWGRPNKPFSSGYEFQVLVSPDGYLQAVLGVRKVPPKMYGERVLSIAFEVIDIALTILMIIDIVTIPVVLFRLGVVVAKEAAIRAVEVAIDREAKAALKLVEQEAKAQLELATRLEARASSDAVRAIGDGEARSAPRGLFQKQRAVALEQTAAAKEAEALATEGKIATAGSPERAQRLRAQAKSLRGEAAKLRGEAADYASGAKSATADLPTPEEVEKELDKIALGGGKPQKGFRVPLSSAERTPEAIARLQRSLQSTARGRVVFRVEGGGSMPRLGVDAAGNVSTGTGTLNLNFGSLERAMEFLEKRGPGARIISFEVDEAWVQSVRSAAMPEHMTGALGRDIRLVDVSYADDQMQIPEKLLHEMEKFIVPGSGKVLLVK
jgi:hypothetical protein